MLKFGDTAIFKMNRNFATTLMFRRVFLHAIMDKSAGDGAKKSARTQGIVAEIHIQSRVALCNGAQILQSMVKLTQDERQF